METDTLDYALTAILFIVNKENEQGFQQDEDPEFDEFYLLETSGSESGSGDEGFTPDFSGPSIHFPHSSGSGSGQGPSGSRHRF